ncbi:hypothetical protein [Nakamurella panacisegetis]|uniref:hypothetical protein n=1 Tax=Nakamurella panacisegetis TaxID=1090615 RepID=UPI0012FD39C3|nr:hypothetical protein [Nakamurella panacisegetis]
MNEPAEVQQFGPAIVITGLALLDARRLITRGIQAGRRDGIQPHPRLQRLMAALDDALEADAVSRNGHHDVAETDPLPALAAAPDQIGTREAANILGLSSRQVQRIARSLEGHRTPSRHWTFDRTAVEAYGYEYERTRRSCPTTQPPAR